MLAQFPAVVALGLDVAALRSLALAAAPPAADWQTYEETRVFEDDSEMVKSLEQLEARGLVRFAPSPRPDMFARHALATNAEHALLKEIGVT